MNIGEALLFMAVTAGATVGLRLLDKALLKDRGMIAPVIVGGVGVAGAWGLSHKGHGGLALPVLLAGTSAASISAFERLQGPSQSALMTQGAVVGEYDLYSGEVPGHWVGK